MLNDKTILITGGTGTFGKAFTEIILHTFPNIKKVIIFSRDEFKQFEMSNLPQFKDDERIRFFVGDVRDRKRLHLAFKDVDIVIHAAALKQIPSCEYNPSEAIKTNVNGAQNVVDVALDRGVNKIVALSTDKACSPINLYGATKLCSDKLFVAANYYAGKQPTYFSVVRYGNVAGSRGSVIPFFKKLIGEGATQLPITDPRMTRFWLKIEDAVGLVLMALQEMSGGEIFVPKIPSIMITDLAEAMLPSGQIKEVGIRPGEKIHEAMISEHDSANTIEFDQFYVIKPTFKQWHGLTKSGIGKPVEQGFEYHSGNNDKWLDMNQIRDLLKDLEKTNGRYAQKTPNFFNKNQLSLPLESLQSKESPKTDMTPMVMHNPRDFVVNVYQAELKK